MVREKLKKRSVSQVFFEISAVAQIFAISAKKPCQQKCRKFRKATFFASYKMQWR
jgi:hypothetical protein